MLGLPSSSRLLHCQSACSSWKHSWVMEWIDDQVLTAGCHWCDQDHLGTHLHKLFIHHVGSSFSQSQFDSIFASVFRV